MAGRKQAGRISCELICADVEGMANGNQGVQDEVLRGPQDADIIWRLDLI